MPTAAAEQSILELFDLMRLTAGSRARMIAGWIDVFLHTLPPPTRKPTLAKLIEVWCEHHRFWTARIDAAVALETERQLTSFDWSETEAALRTLYADLEKGGSQ